MNYSTVTRNVNRFLQLLHLPVSPPAP